MMDENEVILCHVCGKEFYRVSTFESHMRWKHSDKSEEYMCELCGRTFQKKYNLIKHMESGAHLVMESVKCAVSDCDFRTINRKLMANHYQSYHKVALKEITHYFKTVEEFFNWKSVYETKTRARYVKMSSSRQRKNGCIRSTYFCHRDGNFIPKGKNLRHPKMKGSNKINAHCPAKIDVEMGDNIVVASCVETHLGHELDISRLSLEPEEKALIAEKLAMKVPFEQILEEVNNLNKSTDSGFVKRLNLLTRKDLWNIVETFKLNPKDVVYSKTRMRKNKLLAKPKKEIKIENSKRLELLKRQSKMRTIKRAPISLTEEDQIEYDTESLVQGQLVSTDDGNVVYCPVIVQGENGEYQEYALVTDENGSIDDDSCVIINSKGEYESLAGQQFLFTDDQGLPINDQFENEGEMYMVVKDEDNTSESELMEEGFEDEESGNQIVVQALTYEEPVRTTTSLEHSNASLKAETSTQVSSEAGKVKPGTDDESDIFYVEDEEIDADSQFVSVEHFYSDENEEFELAVDEDGNQYMIIPSKDEPDSEAIASAENIIDVDPEQTLDNHTIITSQFLNEEPNVSL